MEPTEFNPDRRGCVYLFLIGFTLAFFFTLLTLLAHHILFD